MRRQEMKVYWSYGQFFIEAPQHGNRLGKSFNPNELTGEGTHFVFENGLIIYLHDDDDFYVNLQVFINEPVSSEGTFVCSSSFRTPSRMVYFYAPDSPPGQDARPEKYVTVTGEQTDVTVFSRGNLEYDVFLNSSA